MVHLSILGALSVRLTEADEVRHVEDAARVATEGIIRLTRKLPGSVESIKKCDQDLMEIEMHEPLPLPTSGPGSEQATYSWLQYATRLYQ